jgi:hypothetical protein
VIMMQPPFEAGGEQETWAGKVAVGAVVAMVARVCVRDGGGGVKG